MPSQLCLAHDAVSVAREHSGAQLQGPSHPAGQSPLSQDSSHSGPSGPFLRNLGLPCAPTRVQTGSQSSQCLGHSHFRLDPETLYWLYLQHNWTTGIAPLGIWAVGPQGWRLSCTAHNCWSVWHQYLKPTGDSQTLSAGFI